MPELQDAAVLVPLFRDDQGELRLVLVRRGEGGIHGGQLAFPGGRREADDRTPLDTAIREACEETGLSRDAIEVLDRLPVIETLSTGFRALALMIKAPPRVGQARLATSQFGQARPRIRHVERPRGVRAVEHFFAEVPVVLVVGLGPDRGGERHRIRGPARG